MRATATNFDCVGSDRVDNGVVADADVGGRR